jgi:hypothetical protein
LPDVGAALSYAEYTIRVWFPKILSAEIRLMMENQRIIRGDAFDPSSAGNIGR